MQKGCLCEYFKGVVAKHLSAVEIDALSSNQHEFNGTNALKTLFGSERQSLSAKFVYVNDDGIRTIDEGMLTWYDAREKHPTRSEFRLYYKASDVFKMAHVGDPFFVALTKKGEAFTIVAQNSSTIASQLAWLFGVDVGDDFSERSNFGPESKLEFVTRHVLEEIGIILPELGSVDVDEMLEMFNGRLPATKEFSSYARSKCTTYDVDADPDAVLISWFSKEELLFRAFEQRIIQVKLKSGFQTVDEFIAYSLSVQNRRKSRAGQSFENHLSALFELHGLKFDRTKVTENKQKPDFIFPGIKEYHDDSFQVELLTMLGAKSTCKDRWRQVLPEAERIPHKHLVTLEPAISVDQTEQMKKANLQLVVPTSIAGTYTIAQQEWLMSVAEFISYVKDKQMSVV